MDAGTLQDAIAEVCPVQSVRVGNGNDRSTWSFVPGPGATSQQIAAGNNVIATLPTLAKGAVTNEEFIGRFTNAEYLSLLKKRALDIAADNIGNAKKWDIISSGQVIDFNRKKVQNLKADLVADGILTQARADVIFAV